MRSLGGHPEVQKEAGNGHPEVVGWGGYLTKSEGSGKRRRLGMTWEWSVGGREGYVATEARSYQELILIN